MALQQPSTEERLQRIELAIGRLQPALAALGPASGDAASPGPPVVEESRNLAALLLEIRENIGSGPTSNSGLNRLVNQLQNLARDMDEVFTAEPETTPRSPSSTPTRSVTYYLSRIAFELDSIRAALVVSSSRSAASTGAISSGTGIADLLADRVFQERS